jgi:hypothetical protein
VGYSLPDVLGTVAQVEREDVRGLVKVVATASQNLAAQSISKGHESKPQVAEPIRL